MIIRAARPHEAQELSELCLRSKAYWPYDPAFIESCRDELTIAIRDIERGYVQVAEKIGKPIGVVKLEDNHPVAELELLFVDPDFIGENVGRKLLQWAIDTARTNKVQKLTTVADPYAAPFYARMGFKKIGNAPSASIPGRDLPEMALTL